MRRGGKEKQGKVGQIDEYNHSRQKTVKRAQNFTINMTDIYLESTYSSYHYFDLSTVDNKLNPEGEI